MPPLSKEGEILDGVYTSSFSVTVGNYRYHLDLLMPDKYGERTLPFILPLLGPLSTAHEHLLVQTRLYPARRYPAAIVSTSVQQGGRLDETASVSSSTVSAPPPCPAGRQLPRTPQPGLGLEILPRSRWAADRNAEDALSDGCGRKHTETRATHLTMKGHGRGRGKPG